LIGLAGWLIREISGSFTKSWGKNGEFIGTGLNQQLPRCSAKTVPDFSDATSFAPNP
jgi:uncharacterized protein YcnI